MLQKKEFDMKLAAIDVGSNAARIQISKVVPKANGHCEYKKIEYIRFPLQLGKDVFRTGIIEKKKKEQFLKLMRVFQLMIDLHEVQAYCAYATSAMREAENGKEIVGQIEQLTGLNLEIIDGQKEAIITDFALSRFINEETVIHIDVGGGSTELNIHYQGNKIQSKSFAAGSVRKLNPNAPVWEEICSWVQTQSIYYPFTYAIGTGGNINKLHQLIRLKDLSSGDYINYNQIQTLKGQLKNISLAERMVQFNLNPDRADVIVPATEIYLHVMQAARVNSIRVPKVGLKDGMIKMLHNNLSVTA